MNTDNVFFSFSKKHVIILWNTLQIASVIVEQILRQAQDDKMIFYIHCKTASTGNYHTGILMGINIIMSDKGNLIVKHFF